MIEVVEGASLYLLGNTTFENNIPRDPTKYDNKVDVDTKLDEGGALTVDRGTVFIMGTTYFNSNAAKNGAAISATSSNIHIAGNVIYLYQSELTCTFTSFLKIAGNHAFNSGGAICAISSVIDVVSLNHKLPSLLLAM